MKTASHVLIGRFVSDYVAAQSGIILDKQEFVHGSVLPDRRITFLTRPHFLKYNAGLVQRKIYRLLNAKAFNSAMNGRISRRLGILCHYYADFFCFAHSPRFKGGLAAHRAYEERLHAYLKAHISQFSQPAPAPAAGSGGETDAKAVYASFSRLHDAWCNAGDSFGNDLAYAILACVEAVVMIAGALSAEKGKAQPCAPDALYAA